MWKEMYGFRSLAVIHFSNSAAELVSISSAFSLLPYIFFVTKGSIRVVSEISGKISHVYLCVFEMVSFVVASNGFTA